MNKKTEKKLLHDFFSEDLTEEQKREFLEKASSDPEFLKKFVKGVELEDAYEQLFGQNEEKKRNNRGE